MIYSLTGYRQLFEGKFKHGVEDTKFKSIFGEYVFAATRLEKQLATSKTQIVISKLLGSQNAAIFASITASYFVEGKRVVQFDLSALKRNKIYKSMRVE